MQGKLKVITIGDYEDSILEKSFKDNENIEFLELPLNRDTKDLNTNFSKKDIVFLRTNAENLEKLLEVGKALKEKEIVTVTVLEEKIVMENRKVLEETINAIFPATKKDDIDNLFLELIKMIYNIIFERCYINLDIEDVRNMLRDSGITVFGSLNIRLCHNKQLINSHFYRGVSELPYKLLFAVIYTHLEFRYEMSHTITSHHVHHFHQTRIPDGTLLDYMVQYRKPLFPQFFLYPKKFLPENNPHHKEFHLRPYIQNNANQ